jgi:hypothetical protein
VLFLGLDIGRVGRDRSAAPGSAMTSADEDPHRRHRVRTQRGHARAWPISTEHLPSVTRSA